MEQQLVIFEIQDEQFGVDIASVESIIKMQPLTRIPHTLEFVEGVTNLRGVVVPVIDLRKRFHMKETALDKESRIMITNLNGVKVGMIVDSVSEVLTISTDIIDPTPPMISTINTDFIDGIARINEQLVILLDLEKVLSLSEKSSLTALPASV